MSTGECLSDVQLAALRIAARRVHTTTSLDEPHGVEAVDRLVDLVGQIVREVRTHERDAMLRALADAIGERARPRSVA
ncbi:hypothetical protein [Nocardioides taihuensis]|uniref:Uncharacterized protein n=1 Tax=Nocardioides taihuensis TaxID=1835606 RepID=A0ABW0BPS8_9ACTN